MIQSDVCRNIERECCFADGRTCRKQNDFARFQTVCHIVKMREIGVYDVFHHVAGLQILNVLDGNCKSFARVHECLRRILLRYAIDDLLRFFERGLPVFALIAKSCDIVARLNDATGKAVASDYVGIILAVCGRRNALRKFRQIGN